MPGVRDQSNGRADVADLTDIQLNWAGTFTGVPLTPTNGSTGSDADPSTTAANEAPLKATDSDIFFGKDSADLTSDDKTSLDAYAKAYTDAQSTSDVTIDGYGSIEGDAGHNKDLSQNRVQAVADYLVSKGVAKDMVKQSPPHGGTKQWGGDLASNRRVTLAPKPPAAPATVSPNTTPTKPPDLDPSSPANKQGLQKTLEDSNEVEDWIRKHLKDNGLRPDPLSDKGDRAQYKNKSTAVDDVVTETLQAGKNASLKDPTLLTDDRVRNAVTDVLMESIPRVPGAKNPAKATFTLQYQFVPFTDHTGLSDGKKSTDQPGHQIQLQITAKFHGEDESGAEIQGQLTGTLFADGANQQIQWQQVQGGAQIAWVQNFFNNNLSVSPQFAVSFGGARAPMGQSQTMQWTPTGQVTAGGQVTYKVPGFKGQLQVGLQGQVGGTGPSGSQSTFDKTWLFTLTYTF